MPREENQKTKLLYLAQLFLQETDETHGLTLSQLAKKLEAQGIHADRKTLYRDLDALRQFGLDLVSSQQGRSTCYFLASRPFELAELKLLVDSVQAARFLTEKKSNQLIAKLEGLTSRSQATQLRRQVYTAGRAKTMNESVYYNVDCIHAAIGENVQIRFQYFQWNAKKEQTLRHNGQWYQVSPWGLLCQSENYYLIGYDDAAGKIKHYRVDKMLRIAETALPRVGKEYAQKLDLPAYSRRIFGMFDGQEVQVTLEGAEHLAGAILDRFGTDIWMHPLPGGLFRAIVPVAVSDQFLGWIFGLGDQLRIVAPPSVVEQMGQRCRRLAEQYHTLPHANIPDAGGTP